VQLEERVKRRLADLTDTMPDDWFLTVRLREGMYETFCALSGRDNKLELAENDQKSAGGRKKRKRVGVLAQSWTCATAVNPILTAGLTPEYHEISADYLSYTLDKDFQSGHDTLAALWQHSLGIPAQIQQIKGVVTLEDSAHCLGLIARDENGKPLADVSFHSFGVEKLLPTQFGGAVWVNPDSAFNTKMEQVRQNLRALTSPDIGLNLRYRLYKPLNGVFNRIPSTLASRLKSYLTSKGVFIPPIEDAELRGEMTRNSSAPSKWMLKKMLNALENYEVCIHQRQKNTYKLCQLLESELEKAENKGKIEIPKGVKSADYLIRFPIIFPTAELARKKFDHLKSAGYWPGKWYNPTFFPGVHDADKYFYNAEEFPQTQDVAARTIQLPTNAQWSEIEGMVKLVFN
jgi:dTDP-4-amino-4,6-dideoxygalactose transaminase